MIGCVLFVVQARTNLKKIWDSQDVIKIEDMNEEQLESILQAMHIEISFVDENDVVIFLNRP